MLVKQHRYLDAIKWKIGAQLKQHAIMEMQVESEKLALRVGTPDFSVARSCLGGEFEDVIAAAGDVGDGLIIDAGGYIGTAAIVFAKAFPRATVVTLEPSIDNFAILKRNTAKFPNIVAINKALGAAPGTIELQTRGTGQWGFTIVPNPQDRPATALHMVEVTTVDEVLKAVRKDRIDIFKIDIEGGEFDLLSSNIGWIEHTHVIVAELHDRIIDGCTAVFEHATANRRNNQLDGEKIMSLG
jgi:FkbM family methyltransferase